MGDIDQHTFEAHYGALLAFCRRRSDSAHDAEDAAAETLVVAWRKRGDVDEISRAWLLAIARRVLANQRRGARRRLRLTERLHTEVVVHVDPAAEGTPLAEAFAALSERDRETLALVAWDGLTPQEAARVAGVSDQAFHVRLHRARRRLRAALEDPTPEPIATCPTTSS